MSCHVGRSKVRSVRTAHRRKFGAARFPTARTREKPLRHSAFALKPNKRTRTNNATTRDVVLKIAAHHRGMAVGEIAEQIVIGTLTRGSIEHSLRHYHDWWIYHRDDVMHHTK